ncbi:MAG: bifunctional riboflavin kinase/FAD synthetase [Cyclobacteriaceae bacterium]|nr:bifunctional riboflavin kinase/FAD synthetase [Cyclobacteriaceae bacterium]
MKIHQGIEHLTPLKNAVVTSGTFDGVHFGHQKILKRVIEAAKRDNGESVVITFWPHPRIVLFPNHGDGLKLLNTFDEKAKLIAQQGIDHLVSIAFTKEFSQLTSQQFIQQILIDKIGTKRLIIGYDHKFGRNREGSFEHLKTNSLSYGFEVEEIPRQDLEDVGVSSTIIRKNLEEGKVEVSNNYLGHRFSVSGKVIKGNQLGRTIGYPTANIQLGDTYKLIPADGVYAAYVSINEKEYQAMVNIGYRPTVDGQMHTIEANIFHFSEDIYEKEIEIHFIKMLRKEIKFDNMDELKAQLSKDNQLAIAILNR